MEREETDLMKQRSEASRTAARNSYLTFIAANLIACLLLLSTAYVTLTGITARRRAEEALFQHRQLLQVTLSSIGDAVIATDTQGSVTFLNPVAQTLTGRGQ